ncbi:phage tail tip lysozyme [Rhizobium leguminosarum]|uniref:phage tail tip lysozyme n=1 Tax=Rhizobium leguminosarum TaxID=384 RepID=UPI003F95186A
MTIDKAKFCLECVYQGYFFGVSPHYIAAIAELRSTISSDSVTSGLGPFGFSATEWAANEDGGTYHFGFSADHIADWRLQAVVFAYMLQQIQGPALRSIGHPPNSIELYLCQILGVSAAATVFSNLAEPVANALPPQDFAALSQRFPGVLQGTGEQTVADLDAAITKALNVTEPFITQAVLDLEDDQHNFVGVSFDEKAPGVMKQLMRDFGFKDFQAAGILGNLGHECMGFQVLQEVHPISGRGGYGWFQWTGSRRNNFENYCKSKNVSLDSDDGNYGFLCEELKNSERTALNATLSTTSLEVATEVFTRTFERPGVLAYNSRVKWARRAMKSYQQL